MRLTRTGKPDNFYYYVIEDIRTEDGKRKTRTVESLGSAMVICETYKVSDAEQWCRDYVRQKNFELKAQKEQSSREVILRLKESMPKSQDSLIFNVGYLILESVYYSFGLSNICREIMMSHPHVNGFDLNEVLKTMLFGRILFPSSKHRLVNTYQHKLLESHDVELQHVYRAMDLLNDNNTLIQDRLFYYTSQEISRDINHIYYDCTNFYTETEGEDCDKDDKKDEWYKEHTLRRYGVSKEHRPNPIVQMGLLMDGDGLPLGFNINPGNTSEQITLIPLEKEVFKNFETADVIICTDSGLSSEGNRKYNNRDADDPLVRLGKSGQRRFICTQSVKKLPEFLKEWALNNEDWSYATRDASGQLKIGSGFNLSSLKDDDLRAKYYNTVFFKERTTAEKGLDSRLVVSFSIKYQEYLRGIREGKIKRASKMIANGTYDTENERSPKRFISKKHLTDSGEEAKKKKASLNKERISEDEQYDGFYALTTNIFKEEMSTHKLVGISERRWEIEECFRIMKTDLEARPFFHSKDNRIIAHFQTCFMSLLLIRGIERRLATLHGKHDRYPNGKYTITEILDALKALNVISIDEGQGYQPDYTNSEVIRDLLKVFSLEAFGQQVVMQDTMKKILKKIKTEPKRLKNKKKA